MRNMISGVRFPVFCVILILRFSDLSSQEKSFSFRNLTVENGLSSNRITSFLQDRKGFMWIGTEEGLNRFDGYTFKTYLNKRSDKNSLSHNYVWSLCEDKEGIIWIATNGGGLNKFDPVQEKFYHYRHDPKDSSSLSSDIVQCVYIDRQNNLWAGTWGAGLNLFHPEKNSFARYLNNPGNPHSLLSNKVWCIYEDSKKNLWVGTDNGGLSLFDMIEKKFKHFLPDPGSENSISGNSAVTILEDSRGFLWIGTYGEGLDRYDYKTGLFTNYKKGRSGSITGNFIWKVYEDNRGLIWVATQSGGINVYDYKSNRFTPVVIDYFKPEDVSANNGRAIFEDRSSNLWIGTIVGGIYKTDRKPKKFLTIKKNQNDKNSLPEDFIFTMCEDKTGDIWIGTYNYLCRYSPSKKKYFTYPVNKPAGNSVDGEIIRYIFEDSRGDLWIGTYFGRLNKYERITDSFIKYNLDFNKDNASANNVRVIYEDRKGLLWFGTNGDGLIKYDRGKNNHEVFDTKSSDISGDAVLSIAEDSSGNLWIGTFSRGLNKFNNERKSFQKFFSDENDPASLSDNSVTELFCDSKGNLWAGTFSGGLCRYNPEKNNFEIFKEEDGLSGNFICGILEDKNSRLWISTSKGLSMFDPELKSFKNYDFNDGLQKGEFNPAARLKTREGLFYFGGLNGINYFHPDSLTNISPLAPVIITSFKVHNNEKMLMKDIVYTDTIILNYDEDNFSFEFSSLDYTFPERNLYAYKLEGLDKGWNYSGSRRFAGYTHLDPGEYMFKAKGTNSEGLWNEAGTSVVIIIKPPFWGTWWFRGILFSGLVLAVSYIYKRRISILEKDKKAQEEFSKRLIQSQEEERKRIASELHDSLGQNLLIIKNRAALGLKSEKQEFGKEQLNEISAAASSVIDEVRTIAYNLHPYQLDRLGLTKAIKSILTQIEDFSNVHFKDSVENIDGLFVKESEINIYRIVQECVNNIVKHSDAAAAEINVYVKEDKLNIVVSDNGKGFEAKKITNMHKGFGLKNIYERTRILHGEFSVESAPGEGTTVSIKIPLN